MLAPGEQGEFLRLLADHEEAVCELYRAYADRLRDEAEFWMTLAAEEAVHQNMVTRLSRQTAEGRARLEPKRFSKESLQTSITHVRTEVEKARVGQPSEAYALSMALDIESAMIERKFFEVFEGDSNEAQAVLKALANGTFAHRDRVRDAWQRLQGGQR